MLIETAAEPIPGSTRATAGTAAKAALNLFSNPLMVRLGRVYLGQMVDMRAHNANLPTRAVRMLLGLTDCSATTAQAALDTAGGKVELAVLIVRGMPPAEAEALLARHHGNLHAALVNERGHNVRTR